MLEFVGLVGLGFAIAVYGTIIGAGGGFVLVPALLLLYPGYEPDEITAISLAVVFGNAVSGSLAYARQRRIDYLTGLLFAAAAAPGVVAGALVVDAFPERAFTAIFGLLLILVEFTSWRARPAAIREPLRGAGVLRRTVTDPEGRVYLYAYRAWQASVLGLSIGFVSSLLGIGGGIMQVPSMIILLHIPVQFAVPTSLFSLGFMSGGATLVHLATGTLGGEQAVRAAALAVGAIPGGQVGAALGLRVRARSALILLASGIGILGVRLLVKASFGW